MQRGYDAARVSEIARRASLTPGAVYARWRNKSETIVAGLDHIFEQILPDRKLGEDNEGNFSPPESIAALGAKLLVFDERRDVMTQVFGSARNNAGIQECLTRFLNEEADQFSRMIDRCKEEGLADPELSTAAMALICQAIALGTQLLLSNGLDDRHVPSEDEWKALLYRLSDAVSLPEAATP